MTSITTLRSGASQPKEPARLIDANNVMERYLAPLNWTIHNILPYSTK